MLAQIIMGLAVIAALVCYFRTIWVLQEYFACVDEIDLHWLEFGLGFDVIATVMMMIMAKGKITTHGILGFIALGLMAILWVRMYLTKEKSYTSNQSKHTYRKRTVVFGWFASICWGTLFIYSIIEKVIMPIIVS